jgi:hypothetical protein
MRTVKALLSHSMSSVSFRPLPRTTSKRLSRLVVRCAKYVGLFSWARDIGCIYGIDGERGQWTNFWDPLDPVADQLTRSMAWRRGQPIQAQKAAQPLFRASDPDSGEIMDYPRFSDVQTSNIEFSCGGGLQAHNYWDNQSQFVRPLATIVRSAAGMNP